MKEGSLKFGIAALCFGVLFMFTAIFTEGRLDALFWGYAAAGLSVGIFLVSEHVYWHSPKRASKYRQHSEKNYIEEHDELLKKLRDKTNGYVLLCCQILVDAALVFFTVLILLDVITSPLPLMFFLCFYTWFQILSKKLIYRHLLKKY